MPDSSASSMIKLSPSMVHRQTRIWRLSCKNTLHPKHRDANVQEPPQSHHILSSYCHFSLCLRKLFASLDTSPHYRRRRNTCVLDGGDNGKGVVYCDKPGCVWRLGACTFSTSRMNGFRGAYFPPLVAWCFGFGEFGLCGGFTGLAPSWCCLWFIEGWILHLYCIATATLVAR
jgi:hypothetical protein